MPVRYEEANEGEAVKLAEGNPHMTSCLDAALKKMNGQSACRACPRSEGIVLGKTYSHSDGADPSGLVALVWCKVGGGSKLQRLWCNTQKRCIHLGVPVTEVNDPYRPPCSSDR